MKTTTNEALEFKTWQIIKLGTGIKNLRLALKENGVHIGTIGNRNVLDEFPIRLSDRETKVDLVLTTPTELGVDQVALREKVAKDLYEVNNRRALSRGRDEDTVSMKETRERAKNLVFLEDIMATAQDQGLELCSPEVAVQLCLQTKTQPDETSYHIAMAPIYYERFGFSYAFYLCYWDNERQLNVCVADPKARHNMDSQFIFIKTEQSARKNRQLTPEPSQTENVEIPKVLELSVDYTCSKEL